MIVWLFGLGDCWDSTTQQALGPLGIVPGVDDLLDVLEDLTVGDLLVNDSDEEPYTTTGIYSVTIEQVYVDDRVTYERNVTVAPVSPATG